MLVTALPGTIIVAEVPSADAFSDRFQRSGFNGGNTSSLRVGVNPALDHVKRRGIQAGQSRFAKARRMFLELPGQSLAVAQFRFAGHGTSHRMTEQRGDGIGSRACGLHRIGLIPRNRPPDVLDAALKRGNLRL